MNRRDAITITRDVIASRVSLVLEGHGFHLIPSKAIFQRATQVSRQQLHLGVVASPSYAPGALFTLHPVIHITYPDVAALLIDESGSGSGVAIGQDLAYGRMSGEPAEWDVLDDRSAAEVGSGLAVAVKERALPLFDDLRDSISFLDAFDRRDSRILMQTTVFAAAVAANLVHGRRDRAAQIAGDHLPGPMIASMFPALARELGDV